MANTPVLDVLVNRIGPLAQQLGVQTLVIVGRDPQTGEVKLFGETAAKTDNALRQVVRDKFGFDNEPETAWNDT